MNMGRWLSVVCLLVGIVDVIFVSVECVLFVKCVLF